MMLEPLFEYLFATPIDFGLLRRSKRARYIFGGMIGFMVLIGVTLHFVGGKS